VNQRFAALDAFRGAAVALMILVNNPGSWAHLYPPLEHAPWHGCTPTDLVFPFFLFAVGNALAFVMPGLHAGPAAAFWRKVAQRTAIVFAIGVALSFSPFMRWDAQGELVARGFETLRTMGVLQRIALCWGSAAVIVWAWSERGAWFAAAALLLGYWAACLLWGGSDPYSLQGWFGTAVDRALLGESHLYRGEGVPFDPEGLASTPPAVAQVLLGYLAGQLVRKHPPGSERVARLFVAAAVALVIGYAWQLEFPLNKKIWSSSYVLHSTGLALAALALLVWRIDVQRKRGAATAFFEVFGKNALFVFVLSGFVPRVLSLVRWSDGADAEGKPRWLTPLPWAYRTLFADIGSDPRLGSFLFSVANLALYWGLAVWLDRRRVYIRV
jgi:predicted acyltransferase